MKITSTMSAVAGLLTFAGAANADLAYGTTLEGALISFNTNAPGTLLSGVAITGMQPNEVVRGIDFRPATGQLYALGSFSRLYTLNTTTGAATLVGSGFGATTLNGSQFGFDFNPTVDRIRIVSDADQNLRAHPTTGGVVFTDGTLAYNSGDPNFGRNPNVVLAAYTNSFPVTGSTTLYVIDSGLDVLAIQNPPNAGGLVTVGAIGADITDMGGFDIGLNNVGFVAIRDAQLARTTFWTINLSTGAGMMVGEVGGGAILTSLAVIPSPGVGSALALGGLVALRRRR